MSSAFAVSCIWTCVSAAQKVRSSRSKVVRKRPTARPLERWSYAERTSSAPCSRREVQSATSRKPTAQRSGVRAQTPEKRLMQETKHPTRNGPWETSLLSFSIWSEGIFGTTGGLGEIRHPFLSSCRRGVQATTRGVLQSPRTWDTDSGKWNCTLFCLQTLMDILGQFAPPRGMQCGPCRQ